MNNQFLMWGERGMVAMFFFELSKNAISNPEKELLKKFLERFEFTEDTLINFSPQSMWCIIDPDFGNDGFGHPDAVFFFEDKSNKKKVFIFEAKRTPYSKSCWGLNRRGEEGFNSCLNGQLELNYRLACSLQDFSANNHSSLKEPEWITKSPYNDKHSPRILKNKTVIANVINPIITGDNIEYYHLILTTDYKNPFTNDKNVFPELYDSSNINQWEKLKKYFGWINYDSLLEIAKSYFPERYWEKSFELNKNNMNYSKSNSFETNNRITTKNAKIVFLPEIDTNNVFHFSWQNESAVLRKYINPSSPPTEIKKHTRSEIESLIKEQSSPPRKPWTDSKYWYSICENIKKEWNSNTI